MTVLVEDTPRNNLAAWTAEALMAGSVGGAVLSPFSSPYVGNNYKPAAVRIAEQVRAAGGRVWFDAATHALQMPGVGDFRYYDGWDLWGGERGDLSNRGLRRDHVRRVFDLQREIGAGPLAPTVLLHGATGATVELAIALAEEAVAETPDCGLTIAGTTAFWASEDDLDAVVGAFAQLNATAWWLTVARPTADLPVAASSFEIAGLCRTARSLQQFGYVHVSHGDFAGLPAIAAGASSVGTGWDSRQRVCSFTSYEAREPSAGGGGWFKRPTLQGLLGFLPRRECERLWTQDATLAASLVPGPLHPDAPREAFLHHAACLRRVVDQASNGGFEDRFRSLAAAYQTAREAWPDAAAAAGTVSAAHQWIDPFSAGLLMYGESEGWT